MPLGVPKDSKHRRSKAESGPLSRSRSKTNPENEERTCKRALFCKAGFQILGHFERYPSYDPYVLGRLHNLKPQQAIR